MSDSGYITTNIRLSKHIYLRLKHEAAERRKSFSAIVREKMGDEENKRRSKEEVEQFMLRLRQHAAESAKYFKGKDGVTIIREMRDNAKW